VPFRPRLKMERAEPFWSVRFDFRAVRRARDDGGRAVLSGQSSVTGIPAHAGITREAELSCRRVQAPRTKGNVFDRNAPALRLQSSAYELNRERQPYLDNRVFRKPERLQKKNATLRHRVQRI